MFATDPPILFGEIDTYILAGVLCYVSERYQRLRIEAPVGFECNGASIPRLARWLYSPHGRYTRAAIIHDYLYSVGGRLPHITLSRAECDLVFLDAMADLGVSRAVRVPMYWAVRVGGWRHFKDPN